MASGTYSGNTTIATGITLTTGAASSPVAVPKALIATRAIQLKDGWVGQVCVADEVTVEKAEFETAKDAEEWATEHVVKRLRKLFAA